MHISVCTQDDDVKERNKEGEAKKAKCVIRKSRPCFLSFWLLFLSLFLLFPLAPLSFVFFPGDSYTSARRFRLLLLPFNSTLDFLRILFLLLSPRQPSKEGGPRHRVEEPPGPQSASFFSIPFH